jgi:cytochrome oxidase Cu insertion factor (SCO1/SenC/PrrC family)
MKAMSRRKVLAAIGSLPLAAGVGALAARTRASASTAVTKGLKVVGGPMVAKPGQQSARSMIQERHLPNLRLVTQDDRPARFYDDLVKDKKVIINFLNTQQPENCSVTTTNLANLQKLFAGRVGKDMHMYSISLNPNDTPASMKAWADQRGHRQPGQVRLRGGDAVGTRAVQRPPPADRPQGDPGLRQRPAGPQSSAILVLRPVQPEVAAVMATDQSRSTTH